MRNINELQSNLGHIDLYLLDQILKERYKPGDYILEAGCGHGRNIRLLDNLGFDVFGVDLNEERILYCQELYPLIADKFTVADLTTTNFENDKFDHIISSAVLHFAESTEHFEKMFNEQVRILKKGGTFFIRMCTAFGLSAESLIPLSSNQFLLPDDTKRFLLTYPLLYRMMEKYNLNLLDPVKTVNVHEMRAMGVIILQKRK